MKLNIGYNFLPAQNKFFLDYISGKEDISEFFSIMPSELIDIKKIRKSGGTFPDVCDAVLKYNKDIGAPQEALDNASKLSNKNTFTVITGQQAGFLGGPVYTVYKIATAINITWKLNKIFPEFRFIPIFWMASEDHDFQEINHTYFIKSDGEAGKVKFDWHEEGKSVYDLIVNSEIKNIADNYLTGLSSFSRENIFELFSPKTGENYSRWTGRILTSLFGKYGLVILEPQILRPFGEEINRKIIQNYEDLAGIIGETNSKLEGKGYNPPIGKEDFGLFTYDEKGYRVKIKEPEHFLNTDPKFISPGALLRPLWADYFLPSVVSVLGGGEIAYQGQVKGLYKYMNIPQPILIPRQSYTFSSERERLLMNKYFIKPDEVFATDIDSFYDKLVPAKEVKVFSEVRKNITSEIGRLGAELEKIEPNLLKTLEQTINSTVHSLEKLEDKTIKAYLGRKGYSKKELRELNNSLFPFGKLQERVFPVTHFLNYTKGDCFIRTILEDGDFMNFRHKFIFPDEK